MEKDKLQEMKLEETFSYVEDILQKLSDPEASLEGSFELYKEGMEALSHCNDVIDRVEKQMIVLNDDSDAKEEE